MKKINQMLLAFILGLLVLNGNTHLQADPAQSKPEQKQPQAAKKRHRQSRTSPRPNLLCSSPLIALSER